MNRANRPRQPRISGSSYASRALSRAGDGSTLSLDFTTGVLDPRLTFTRTTNATFINSSGLVEWAAANMFINSVWTDANNTPTGWTLGTSTGTISRSGETRTFTCAAQQYWFYQQPATKNGLTYTLSFEITAVSGTFTLGDVLLAGSSTSSPSPLGWYKDGAFLAGGGSTQATTGRFALVFTANADNTICRIGLGTAGVNVTGSVTIRYTQIQPGIYPSRVYLENTSTSAANHNTPRFDYDPTTLTPRGLLIEGSASNLLSRSEEFDSVGPWFRFNATITANDGTAPDGNTTADSIQATTSGVGGVFRSNECPSGTHTFSVFAKANGANSFTVSVDTSSNGRAVDFSLTSGGSVGTPYVVGTGGTVTSLTASVQAFQNGWVRCIVTAVTTGINSVALYTQSGTSKWLAWGAQLEAGSGASSYIPTGASTGSRAADECQLLDLTTMGFNASEGTIYTDVGVRLNTGSQRNYTFLPASGGNNQIFEGSGLAFNVFSSGSFVAQIGSSSYSGAKIAAAYAVNDYAASVNGAAVATDSAGVLPTSLTKLTIGGSIVNAAAYANGCIRTFKYWPTRLPNAQLQALTT